MEKVTGIGGVFFRAEDPEKLAKWYEEQLGIKPVPTSDTEMPWVQEMGPTVFAPFEKNTDYFGNSAQSWMINFRVNNLSKIVAQLRDSGIKVTLHEEDHPIGKFARLCDPEGNPIELWEAKE